MLTVDKIKEVLQDIDIEWKDDSMEDFKDSMYEANFEENMYNTSDREIDNYRIIGTHSINTNISPLFGLSEVGDYLYLIVKNEEDTNDNENNNKEVNDEEDNNGEILNEESNKITKDWCLYVSIEASPPSLWYEFDDEETLNIRIKELVKLYNIKDIGDNYKRSYAFLGTTKIVGQDICDFEKKFVYDKYTEHILWGSGWDKYPFNRDDVAKATGKELIRKMTQALEQSKSLYTISTRASYSKSIITIIDFNRFFVCHVRYKPLSFPNKAIYNLNNKLKRRRYPLDMPIDVVIGLQYYWYLDHLAMLSFSDNYQFSFIILDHILPLHETKFITEVLDRLQSFRELEEKCNNTENVETIDSFSTYYAKAREKYKGYYVPYKEESFEDWY